MNYVIGQDFVHKPQIRAAAAISSTGATNGTTLQKSALGNEFPDAVAILNAGGYTGGGTVAIVMKIQDSADGSSWSDITDLNIVEAATVTLTGAATQTMLPFRLKHLRDYFRVVVTVTFTAGTSPTQYISADIFLLNPRLSG